MEFSGALPAELLVSADPSQRPEDPVVVANLPVAVDAAQAFVATLKSIEIGTTPSGEPLPTAGNISPLAKGQELPALRTQTSHLEASIIVADDSTPEPTLPIQFPRPINIAGEFATKPGPKPAIALPGASTDAPVQPPTPVPLPVAAARTDLTATQPKLDGTNQNVIAVAGKLPDRAISPALATDASADDGADLPQQPRGEAAPAALKSADLAGLEKPSVEFRLADSVVRPESMTFEMQAASRPVSPPSGDSTATQISASLAVAPAAADVNAASKTLLPAGLIAEDAPLDFRQAEPFAGLATRIQSLAGGQINEARIRLNPPQLGELEIKLTLVDDETFVHLAAAQPAARELLESGLPRLRELLAFAGLELGQATVGDSERRESSAGSPIPTETDVDSSTESTVATAKTKTAGRVDLYA